MTVRIGKTWKEETEQTLDETHSQLEDAKQSLDDAIYNVNDLASYVSEVQSYLSDMEYTLDESIGQIEYLKEELRSQILQEKNDESNSN